MPSIVILLNEKQTANLNVTGNYEVGDDDARESLLKKV